MRRSLLFYYARSARFLKRSRRWDGNWAALAGLPIGPSPSKRASRIVLKDTESGSRKHICILSKIQVVFSRRP